MGDNPLLRSLLGPNHEQVVAKLRARSARRRPPTSSWSGQAGPRPIQPGLRPPPPPGGPAPPGDYRHPWEMPTGGNPAATPPVPASVPGGVTPEAAARSEPVRTARPTPQPDTQEHHTRSPDDATNTQRIPASAINAPSEQQPPPPAGPGESGAEAPWTPVSSLPRDPWWVRLRRVFVLALVAVVVVAGVANIAATVADWLAPAPPAPAPPAVSDVALAGYAEIVAIEYATWDENAKQARQSSLGRFAAPGTDIDGWNGTGTRRALTAATVDITRGPGQHTVVTVRVRTQQPAAATPDPASTGGGRPGWVALAIPVTQQGSRLQVSAPPALVGSAPHAVAPPAVPSTTATGETDTAESTRATVVELLRSYAAGDLAYARAAGTDFAGLGGLVRLAELQQWRVAPLAEGADPTRRTGDATVTWQLPSGARVTCSYVITLDKQQGRWYLAAITPQIKDVSV